MIDFSAFPMCAARLRFQQARLTESSMNEYWAAVAVAEDIEDADLAEFSGFNFDDRSADNGRKLLARLDQFIRVSLARRVKPPVSEMTAEEVSVRSTLGANGIKVSKLSGLDDYWAVARLLWPDHVEMAPKVRDVQALCSQLSTINKKDRPKLAKANIQAVKWEWRAR